ncbi:RNA polymerase sigma-70 factor [Chitinophaga silvatica]|uniref:RNA polymerase sigma-70 factor n=1 Tax=Chitinophaga silvatica TaxID=2282649 RepID=A0A3E1Y265_9BACT|nr:RNA polymerase sigma-70 factor [Chitinophaga silvatica]RFS18780.1 RNA polymerase sigma-70 factor [Chitinophaga silvatica]
MRRQLPAKNLLTMESHDLDVLMPAFRKGNADAYMAFFKTYYKPLVYFADKFLNDIPEAEDVVKDSFFKLWSKHSDFEYAQAVKKFLYLSTKNACLNIIRHSKVVGTFRKEMEYLDSQTDENLVLQKMIHTELLQAIHEEIARLPEKRQQVFRMSFFEGLKNEEVAAKLGISVFTVKEQKARALAQLRLKFTDKQLLLFLAFSALNPMLIKH